MKNFTIRFDSWWYKNCRQQRRKGAKICNECPFKKWIEEQEGKRPVNKNKGQPKKVL